VLLTFEETNSIYINRLPVFQILIIRAEKKYFRDNTWLGRYFWTVYIMRYFEYLYHVSTQSCIL